MLPIIILCAKTSSDMLLQLVDSATSLQHAMTPIKDTSRYGNDATMERRLLNEQSNVPIEKGEVPPTTGD